MLIKETECSLKDIPFNPHCSACCSQPLRKQLKKLHTQYALFLEEKTKLQDFGNTLVPSSVTEYNKVTQWIDDYTTRLKLFPEYSMLLLKWKSYEHQHALYTTYENELHDTRTHIRSVLETTQHTYTKYQRCNSQT